MQLEDYHSLSRLGHELVLVWLMPELVQLTRAQLVQLQLGVGHRSHHIDGEHHLQLIQLKFV